jgi:hypothetical protein
VSVGVINMTAYIHTLKDETPTAEKASGVSRDQSKYSTSLIFAKKTPLAATKGGKA